MDLKNMMNSVLISIAVGCVAEAHGQINIGQAFRAAGDIASFGETARQRDREHARNSEARAAEARRAAEALREQKMDSMRDAIFEKGKTIADLKRLISRSPEIQQALDLYNRQI
jgi:hypothetical protein